MERQFKQGGLYTFSPILETSESSNFNLFQYGKPLIGERIILLKHKEMRHIKITFILKTIKNIDEQKNVSLFECIYVNQ